MSVPSLKVFVISMEHYFIDCMFMNRWDSVILQKAAPRSARVENLQVLLTQELLFLAQNRPQQNRPQAKIRNPVREFG